MTHAERGTPTAIATAGLSKRFGDRVAVNNLDLRVAQGEVFGLLGPNGAGKTTTVRMLSTLLSPSAGHAEVAGIAVTWENGPEIRRHIAVMPETPGLYVRLSLEENLRFFARLYGMRGPAIERRVTAALEAVQLADRRAEVVGALSKGLRQRAALARTLLPDPRVMFLDEPTQGLDPVATHEVRELIGGLRDSGVTIFLTTHRLEEAERLCDRIAILRSRLLVVGRPDELRHRLFSPSIEVEVLAPIAEPVALFGGVDGVTGWRADGSGDTAAYQVDVTDTRRTAPKLAEALVGAHAEIVRLAEREHSLEDVYLELVGEDTR